MLDVELRYVRSRTGCTYSSRPSPVRQKGHECGEAAVERASSARRLMPVTWSGGTQAKRAAAAPRGAAEPDQRATRPSQARGKIGSQNIVGRSEGDIGGMFRQGRTERLTEAAEQLLVVYLGSGDLGSVD